MHLGGLGIMLNKKKLGSILSLCNQTNEELLYGLECVRGVSVNKNFITTKANMVGVSLKPYLIINPNEFVYVADTSRRGDKIAIARNTSNEVYICSSVYTVFKVTEQSDLLPEYLSLLFERAEFDRYARYNSWGSARETFDWQTFCDYEIELPPISIQQKYVDVYKSMLANQQCYEKGLDDLTLLCHSFVENLKKTVPHHCLGEYISKCEESNEQLLYGVEDVKGISIEKRFIDTKANMTDVSLKPYVVVNPNEFAYVTVTSRNGEKISVARNDSDQSYICSSSYIVFKINDIDKLLPEYLSLLFERSEFNRYARFHSWGSARETFDWDTMCEVRIPVPDIDVQHSIVDIYKAYNIRKEINEKLKAQLKDICPILIKGSIEEAKN